MLVRLVVISTIILLVVLFITEIAVPVIKGTRLFPTFRKSNQKKIEQLQTQLEEQKLEGKANELEAKLKSKETSKAEETGSASQQPKQ